VDAGIDFPAVDRGSIACEIPEKARAEKTESRWRCAANCPELDLAGFTGRTYTPPPFEPQEGDAVPAGIDEGPRNREDTVRPGRQLREDIGRV
jgi:hypothetical protein